ncbi:hypothetical protein [Marivivens donghaensis]|uniref:hypothetical protein n=1 Tax=Marivivens donghaensis TaxID=1699413 RepID=UPI00201F0A2C|nr:hypothetical protein [Marivivens donghaensis]MCL7409439.1 hypothetical protein [Marivivens donghaensis]MDN3702918.1 hypothetical protein [Marivivens donghaensis]
MLKQEEAFEVFSNSWEIDGSVHTRSVRIYYTKEWDIQIEEYLTGDNLEQIYGDWDHEEFVIIKRIDAPMLMILLFKHAFNQSEPLSLSSLKVLFRENGLNFDNQMWS